MTDFSHTYICPETGLPVVQKTKWTDIEAGKRFRMTFKKVGRRFFLAEGHGDLSTTYLSYIDLIGQFLCEEFDADDYPVVELKDYADTNGSPNVQIRKAMLAHFFEHKKKNCRPDLLQRAVSYQYYLKGICDGVPGAHRTANLRRLRRGLYSGL